MSISEFIATFAQFYGLTSESSQPVCPKKSKKEVSTLQRLVSHLPEPKRVYAPLTSKF